MMLGRRGKVWGDRWHGRELGSPREVRNALVYVFRNVAKHGTRLIGDGVVDHMSSAPRFRGWSTPFHWHFDDGLRWPEVIPRTWLLGSGWITRGGGPIDPREVKRGSTRVHRDAPFRALSASAALSPRARGPSGRRPRRSP